ncbi:hypothetical protein NESM_000651400 [Novymonas esmeraldas]|uniref:Uncharacterized protein n=1 Tax=Novymonas esmeraldas TaxID=1808958 RepID=A0AAW0ESA8_9TRYP
MYSFSLASKRRSTAAAAAESPPLPPVEHLIRSPSELHAHAHPHKPLLSSQQTEQHHASHPDGVDGGDAAMEVAHGRLGWHPGHEHVPTASLYAVVPPAEQLMQVHNMNSFTDLRETADWVVEVQRERADKKRRALAQHEAVKLEEQRRRDAQEEQTALEMQRRRAERRQERAERRDAAAVADFQARNTLALDTQLRLMELGRYVTQTTEQHKTHAREKLFKNWASRHNLLGGPVSMTSWTGTNTQGYHASAPATETELRDAASATEDAYVRLSLAYRNTAQRSRAAAAILRPAELVGRGAAHPHTTQPASSAVAATGAVAPSSHPLPMATTPSNSAAPSPAPFHTAPPMFAHTSVEHMGEHANAIPYTYIPAFFDAPSATATAVTASPRRVGDAPRVDAEAIMPLPLSPSPVSRDVTGALQSHYYPWAVYSGSAVRGAMLPPAPPPREASLAVHQWGVNELRDHMLGRGVRQDGTIEDQCERKKQSAARRGLTTLPHDYATATSNTAALQVPLHFGKRMDVWL